MFKLWIFIFTIVSLFLTKKNIYSFSDFGEIQNPVMRECVNAMRSYQVQYTNFLFYTMHMNVPGAVELGVMNSRVQLSQKGDYGIRYSPFVRFRGGHPEETNRQLDFYVDAKSIGFFIIQLPGRFGYTRDGRFEVDSEGKLVTLAGRFPVLGESGPIYLPTNSDRDISVSRAGLIYANGSPVDRFRIAAFRTGSEAQYLQHVNGSIMVLTKEVPFLEGPEHYVVLQGYLHGSNVLKALNGDMMVAKHGYEASIKLAQTLSKSITTVSQMAGQ